MKYEKIIKYTLNIGWNNEIKKREFQKAFKVLWNNKMLGFTKINSVGLWNKTKENSFIIEILSNKENPINDNKIYFIKKSLEKELKQYVVLLNKFVGLEIV